MESLGSVESLGLLQILVWRRGISFSASFPGLSLCQCFTAEHFSGSSNSYLTRTLNLGSLPTSCCRKGRHLLKSYTSAMGCLSSSGWEAALLTPNHFHLGWDLWLLFLTSRSWIVIWGRGRDGAACVTPPHAPLQVPGGRLATRHLADVRWLHWCPLYAWLYVQF